jgi:ADP-ribosyl-[dinitrogen reductase] hydrolase
MVLTELPLGLPGRLFRCAMPFSGYDPRGRALVEFRRQGVTTVVILAEAEECLRYAERDLSALYRAEGLDVIHFPIRDLGVADDEPFRALVDAVLTRLRTGGNVAIHCYAGKGRAGTLAACLVRAVLGLEGDTAIGWVRNHVPGAVETTAQIELIRRFGRAGAASPVPPPIR